MKQIFLVVAGGSIGALARYFSYKFLHSLTLTGFPLVTLIINCLGSFLLGLFLQQVRNSSDFALFLAVGILGSFTTFSTFSMETVQLAKDGRVQLFVLNIAGTILLGLLSLAFGMWLSQRIKFA